MKRLIFVEGVADSKFIRDFIQFHYPNNSFEFDIVETKGWTNINNPQSSDELIKNKMNQNFDNGGVNLIVFDADNNFKDRFDMITNWGKSNQLQFELFLFPNNADSGDLETLLEQIINPSNIPIFECWDKYEKCLSLIKIPNRMNPLSIPARKTKIYGYLEALLGISRSQKEKIKESNRDYKNESHWDLRSEPVLRLKAFFDNYFN